MSQTAEPSPPRRPKPHLLSVNLALPQQYPSERGARPLRQRRSTRQLILKGLTVAVLILLIAFFGAILIVLTGPTEFGIVRDRVAGLIRDGLGPQYSVEVSRAVIEVDPVLGFTVRVDDIQVRDSNQALVGHVPSTRFAVDPYSLLRFRADVRQIELSNPEVSFVRRDDGSIHVGNAATARAERGEVAPLPDEPVVTGGLADGGFPDILAALYAIDSGIEPQLEKAMSVGFERFAIINATVNIWDGEKGTQRRITGADLNLEIDKATAGVSVTLAASGFGGRWTASVDRLRDSASGSHVMSATFSQLMVSDLFPALGDDKSLLTADIPLYGRANIRLSEEGAIEDATARIDLGAGVIRFGEEREHVLLDEATVRLRWDVPNKQLLLEPSTFLFGETRGVVAGRVYPQGDPLNRQYAFEFESPGAVLAPRDSRETPIVAQRIAVSGVADLKARVLNFENAVIQAPDAAIAAAGSLGFEGLSPSLVMAATFSPMSVATLKQMWVPLIAPGARRWVMEHVSGGQLVSGRYEAAIPPGILWTGKRVRLPDDSLRLDMRVEGTSFTTFGQLPPIENAAGNITVAGSSVGVDIESGEVRTSYGPVKVEAGAFAVPNTSERPAGGLVELEVSGGAQAMGEVANSAPLLALDRASLKPADLSGSGTASISVRFPLRDALTEADVDWKVVVDATDLASTAPVEGRTVSDADVELTITPADLAIYGKARIDGALADVSMSIPIGVAQTASANSADRRVRLLLDDEARKRFGVGLEGVLSGSISALVSDTPDGKGQHFDLDLTKARVALPGIGWTKGIGVPATLTFDVRPDGDGSQVDRISFKGDGFGFSGSARLDESFSLVSADIGRMSLRPGDDISMKLTRGNGGYAIAVRGSSFDLRGMMRHVRDRNDQAGGFPDIAIDAQIGRLIGFNNEEVRNASLTLVSVGGETQKIAFSGALGDSDVSLNFAVAPDGTTLEGTATDGGRLMRFTDLYTRMAGGVIRLSGQAGRTGPMIGTMEVSAFDVVDEPAMERMVVNDAQNVSSFNPRRVRFDRMVARFARTDRVIVIEDALLAGATVGATFAGRYDLAAATVSITGTYLPAYAFNNLFSRIPILGFALGGGMREGLIGVTFKVDGPIAQPQVFFNPLSVVAPGIFRKIFEFQRPTQ